MVTIIEAFEFQLSRVNGSHHIFENTTITEQLNLQKKEEKLNHTKLNNLYNWSNNTISY